MSTVVQGYRLSPQQARLWALLQSAPELPLGAACALRLRGALDADALCRAVARVAGRHEILRTVFRAAGDGAPVQVVGEDVAPLTVRGAADGLPELERAAVEAAAWQAAIAPRPAADDAPPLRAVLVRRAPDDHVLHLSLPALCADGATLDLLVRDLGAAYAALAGGEDAAETDDPFQYVDYAEWLHDTLESDGAGEGRAFWARQPLAETAPLPAFWPDPAPAGAGGIATERRAWDAAFARRLEAVAAAEGVTVEAWLLAAWWVLIRRNGGEESFAVGVASDGRALEEMQGGLGPFTRHLPVRAEVEGTMPFSAVAAEAALALRQARAWQAFHLGPEGGAEGAARLRFGFDYAELPARSGRWGGVDWRMERRWHETERFSLRLRAEREDGDGGLRVSLGYDAAALHAEGAARLLRRCAVLLEATVAEPDAPVDALPLLDAAEHAEALGGADAVEFPVETPLHRLFERQAARMPDAVAVTCEGEQLTYAALDARANRLARHLRARGAGPESCVGLCVERGVDAIVGILGILKAGAAYVPLDPAYPRERLAYTLEDADVRLVVTETGLRPVLPAEGVEAVALDAEGGGWGDPDADGGPLAGELPPDALAYVIYTSGSTGRPKGVQVSHAGVARLFRAMDPHLSVGARDVWSLFHSLAFDVSVCEMWGALLYGGRLAVVPFAVSRDPEAFRRLLVRERVTVLSQTPSAFRQLIAADAAAGEAPGELALRAVLLAGEALEPAALRGWMDRHGEAAPRVVNLYGITETTVHVTWREMTRADAERAGRSPVGVPLPDLRVHLLDGALRPVPPGLPGEMFVGGGGVARGYRGRPALTAERFLPDPFSAAPGARMYRSGDGARRLAGGELEFLGRLDQQVKVRGFRIEPGEVEAALLAHPAVADAAVVARADGGEARLVAYVVAAGGAEAVPAELRAHLLDTLPDYMVPAAFVSLPRLPLTTNGKLDRRALPAPLPAAAEAEYAAPRTPTEEVLAAIWAEVLGRERVGIDDNYFAVGGDSILSVRIAALARERGMMLEVADLFAHPSVRALAERAARGSPEAAALQAILDRDRRPFDLVPEEDRGRLPEDAEDAYPLAALQAGMLYHQELSPDERQYHNVDSYCFQGAFDEGAFRAALARAAARQDNLRTSIHLGEFSIPLQVVHREVEIPLRVTDIRHLDDAAQDALLAELAERELDTPFDLARAPLLRLQIHLRAHDRFHLTLTENHAINDGWSLTSLFADVFEEHALLLGGEPLPERPRPALRFRDFIELERATQDSEASRRFWAERMAGFAGSRIPRLPAPFRDGGGAGRAGVPLELPPEVRRGVLELARALAVPVKTVLQAAFLKVLSLSTGTRDVVTGLATNGRPEVEGGTDMRGLFLNTIPFRLQLREGSWADLVRQVFVVEREVLPHRRYPMALLQREHGAAPLFEAAFNLVRFHSFSEVLESGTLKVLWAAARADNNYTLSFSARLDPVTGEILPFVFEYRTGELAVEQARAVADRYQRVVREMVSAPQARHDRFPLAAEERARVVEAWSGAGVAPRPAGCIHHAFAEQAARTPDAVALEIAGRSLSYAELDARANRLAHHLRARGAGPERVVAIVADRAPETVVAILAVLKAGAAWLPLDPAYPADRLRYMLADSGARLVVAGGALPAGLRPADLPEIVDLRREASDVAARPSTDPGVPVDPAGLAYVIYTSGSTGRPKGVAVPHRGVPNLARWKRSRLGQRPGDRALQFASLSFDAAVEEVLGALLTGATLVMVGREAITPGDTLRETLRRERISFATLPPAALAVTEPDGLPDLRVVVSAGEALPAAVAARWACAVEMHNAYGPTEATVSAASARMAAGGLPVIGRPLEGVSAYVLDPWGDPVPPGVPGELFIGGGQVARGYLGRPALTADRFVPDGFGGGAGARLYATGDRARWLPDGTLEYLGRGDGQVKIRGYRIELGEVEAMLRADPGVADCAAVVREDEPGDRRLVAYVVGDADADALRARLSAALPDYMVPGAFVRLDALPLTPNGKLDRAALPAPGYAGQDYVAPRTPVETLLAEIWADVLGLDQVGVQDAFVELGGDSILSLMVVSRARREGLEITPAQMFEHPTIAELAAAAAAARERSEEGGAEQGRVEGAVPLTPIQAWFAEQEQPEPAHYNQAVLMEIDPSIPDAVLERALAAVLEHHDALRLRFRRTADGWEQWHRETVDIFVEWIDLSAFPPAERDAAQEEAARARQAGLELERGPVGRAVRFDRGEEGRVLLLVLHHLVVDGVSWRVLREDLERACAQLASGGEVKLGPKSTSYRQWAQALAAYAASDALRAEAAHWRAQGADGVAPLPADGAGEPTQASSRTVHVALDEDETRALLQEVPAAFRAQINDVLLAALAEAVCGWTGGTRVRLALEAHGREEAVGEGVDLTRAVGWFTSVYPVVLDVAGAAGPGDRLRRVKEQLRAIPVRGIGYGVLRYLSPDAALRAALAAQPEPEIGFNYLGQFDQGRAPGGLVRFAGGPQGRPIADGNRRRYPLEVGGGVAEGRLRLGWTYTEGVHREETVRRLADAYVRALRALVAESRVAASPRFTPSDFPLAGVTQAQLDAVTAGRAVEDLYPLSPMQEGLLFHALAGGGAQAYQVQVAQRLEGPLDPEVLRRAWAGVVDRHAILRTSFAWQGLARPLQRVESGVKVPWRMEDWRGIPSAAQDAALDAFLAEERARGLELDRAPLLRCALFRTADEGWCIVWSIHHLLLDGWSASRVMNEVMRLYAGWSAGETVELAPVRPFRDYIAWLERRDPAAGEAYWRGVLAGFAAPTPLPVDRPAAPAAPLVHAREERTLSPELTQRLADAAGARQVTVNTLLQGAWGMLLSRHAGEEDVVFGATVSGRPVELEGVEGMVGMFINTLPVRVRVDGGARLGAWLADLQRAQAAAREHAYAPLVQVQGWSEVPRGMPLFDTLFVFENFPVERSGMAQAAHAVPRVRLTEGRAIEWTNYPLALIAAPGDRLHFTLGYDAARFDAATATRLLDHLERLLEQLADGVDRPLRALRLADDADRARVLEAWNDTAAPYPPDRCIHDVFAEQVARTPDAVALDWGDASLTYRALDAAADRLARHLAGLCVGPEVRVGVLLERGMEMVVAVLAVLKAGGCCVPVDTSYPPERVGVMLADSGARVLLTRGALADGIGWMDEDGPRVVRLDEAEDAIAAEPGDALRGGARAENLAYVFYTSGSTGRPKGVMMPHAQVVQLACAVDYMRMGPGERVAQASNASFDAAVFEFWAPLLTGGTLVGIEREVLLSAPALARALREREIHVLYQTAALFDQHVREQVDVYAGLRELVFGAEAVGTESVRRMLRHGCPAHVLHEYGPTEATVWCTLEQVDEVPEGAPTVSIGRPVPNARAYVLDESLELLPPGVPGELYVGGAGVVRGYLGRPALSAERFVPDPFSPEPGARMYRTGDRARWKADGRLEFLGRLDEQVKVRGFRIEPGEVEGAIAAVDGVRGARVTLREDRPGDKRLVAYVAGEVDAGALRTHLRRILPEHMVPAAFVVMERLPLTPNGKLDRRALPAPDYADAGAEWVAPRTPVEEALAGIWAEVLRVPRVGALDGFFELGGHSLLAIRVVSRVREAFGIELPLRALFEDPTVEALAARVERMRGAEMPAPAAGALADASGRLALSPAQERLWFLDRLQPGGTGYNVPTALRLRGELDVAAVERALGEVVRRHDALRTAFPEVGGSPVQVVAPFTGFVLPVQEPRGADAAEREAWAMRRCREESAAPFDLAAGPLFRAVLLRVDERDHVLWMGMHHIVSDGWSMDVLHRELSVLYAAFRAGGEANLPELPVQYADFAARQRARLRGEALEREMAYWTSRLDGAPRLLELPTDHPRPLLPSFRGAAVPLALPPALLDRLQALGRAEGATLFMVVLAAFGTLLSRYAGVDDVVVGSPVAGRTEGDTEGLIGLFVNMLPLRAELGGNPAFREALRRVRESTLGAYEHQEVPFERLAAELRPERTPGHSPLFQVVLSMDTPDGSASRLPGLEVEGVRPEIVTAKFDLTLSLAPSRDGLVGELTYATDLFERGTVERMAEHLGRVLAQVPADPSVRLDALELIGDDERRRMVDAWNRTARDWPRGVCIHERFAEQVRARPDDLALVWDDVRLTYAELDARANRLAHHLVRHGVGPDARVGVLLERGMELIVSMIAILKAGGCYVPLDPGYPAERLRLMLDDAGVRALIASGTPPESLAAHDLHVVRLRDDADVIASESPEAPSIEVSPDNLAYIVYTSGSTGRPKGVMVAHRHVIQLVVETDYVRLAPGDRVAQASNASFDALAFESWGALLNGATLVGIPTDVLLAPVALRNLLREQGITTLYQTTALLNQLSREQPDIFQPLREVLFGGQAVDADAVRRILKAGGPQRLLHVYGPTETTAWCSWQLVDSVEDDARTVSVGRPTGNQRIYILDRALQPAPIGVPGEAYVGGDGVVRGYLDRPSLTAERFVPDPFSSEPGARMYRTGDRLRWKADGTLEFVGRLDAQVKIRGFRIEPGEIESVLCAYPRVDEARVVVREDQPGEPRLVAYVVGAVDANDLRDHIARELPEYMRPGAIVSMDSLPLTPTGKLDVRALPAPGTGDEDAYVAPRTEVEEALAGIWAEALGVERVGATDGFFALGGHSLLAMRVASRIREVFGVELPLRAIFERPALEDVAGAIAELRREGLPQLPPVVPIDRDRPLPLSFAQERLWFLDRMQPGGIAYNIPAALRLGGALDVAALERALGEVVRRHEALRTTFGEVEGAPVQVIARFAGFALPVEDLAPLDSAEREMAVAQRAEEDAARPFDLEAGPLFRASLLRLADDDHVLLLAMHHVVSDGWSMEVLHRELSALYAAFSEGRDAPLPELPVQYADFAAWQREHLAGEVLEAQLAYWRAQLAGAPERLELPADRPRPPAPTFRGDIVPLHLPPEVLERLRALGRGEGATLFMVLLSAFQLLLARYGGSDDVVVGSPIAGRTRREVEGLIGFFANTLVLRTDLGGDPAFREVVRRVRRTTLGAYEHQDVPFEKLVAELRPERSLAHSPLFQVAFTLNTPVDAPPAASPLLRVAPADARFAPAKFDLMLGMEAGADGLHGALTYSTDLFERATIERMADHLRRMLEQVAADADARVGALELMAPAERALVVDEWNRTETPYPAEQGIARLFELQVERAPDAVALVHGDATLSYGELNALADRLAAHLAARGVGPEVRVGLCLERGPEVIVGILAILKSGGAYVPLDPAYPAERLAYMRDASGVSVLITRESLRHLLPTDGVEIVSLDGDAARMGAEAARPARLSTGARSLAYVMFTSGSTGTPRPVGVEQASVIRLVRGADYVELGPDEVILQASPVSFDAFTFELWGALLNGGRLVLVPGATPTLQELGETIQRHGVTTAWLTAGLFQLMAQERLDDLRGVRQLLAGGDVLPVEAVRRVRERFPACRLINGYGPTENTTFTCCFTVPDGWSGGAVPIGTPIANTRAYVLDGALRPVPVGVPGELYAAGDGVARGYLGRPALTAERFVPDPFSPRPGARMYRTGDHVLLRPIALDEDHPGSAFPHSRTHALHFLGRLDEQVKVRGFRIEPGEVEAVLATHPGVRAAAVAVREDAPGDRRLVAYFTGEADAEAVRAHLRGLLPEYMVPAAFVPLDALPLGPTGKVDRRALPRPEYGADVPYVAPRTEVEETIAELWAEVLQVDRVGVEDGFFDRGGHSLLIMRLVARVRALFGVELSIRSLFVEPTVAGMAAEVERLICEEVLALSDDEAEALRASAGGD
jgi:amino acid adenylation domain-containing protein/non-ribosomal peptide synthase protein (TIGR01720 family)